MFDINQFRVFSIRPCNLHKRYVHYYKHIFELTCLVVNIIKLFLIDSFNFLI